MCLVTGDKHNETEEKATEDIKVRILKYYVHNAHSHLYKWTKRKNRARQFLGTNLEHLHPPTTTTPAIQTRNYGHSSSASLPDPHNTTNTTGMSGRLACQTGFCAGRNAGRNTPGTRDWSRLRDRTLAVAKIRTKIRAKMTFFLGGKNYLQNIYFF